MVDGAVCRIGEGTGRPSGISPVMPHLSTRRIERPADGGRKARGREGPDGRGRGEGRVEAALALHLHGHVDVRVRRQDGRRDLMTGWSIPMVDFLK